MVSGRETQEPHRSDAGGREALLKHVPTKMSNLPEALSHLRKSVIVREAKTENK